MAKLRCQHIGCSDFFTDEDNSDDSCRFHPGPPLFHDGAKEWSCCKQRSHDFSVFLDIPGCTTGKHTIEKPLTKAAPSPNKPIKFGIQPPPSDVAACSRCKQGFFCSDHGAQVGISEPAPVKSVIKEPIIQKPPKIPELPKVVDLNAEQICKNGGCGKTFTERENFESSCQYHPGPPTFHDRLRGWSCCNVHVKDFEEFLAIPPCTRGWHNANPGGIK